MSAQCVLSLVLTAMRLAGIQLGAPQVAKGMMEVVFWVPLRRKLAPSTRCVCVSKFLSRLHLLVLLPLAECGVPRTGFRVLFEVLCRSRCELFPTLAFLALSHWMCCRNFLHILA